MKQTRDKSCGKTDRQPGAWISRLYLLLAGIILTFFRRAGLWPLGTAAYLTLRLLTLAKRTGE